jgi:hypothetical protein
VSGCHAEPETAGLLAAYPHHRHAVPSPRALPRAFEHACTQSRTRLVVSGGPAAVTAGSMPPPAEQPAPMAPEPVASRGLTSERRQAAVDHQSGSGDVASGWAGEEDDGSREFLRVAGPAGGHARELAVDVAVGELVRHL